MLYDVAILIVTYNSEGQIITCLESVLAQRDHVTQQIIVFDNCSTDATVEIVREKFPEVELIASAENIGFAAGVNAASKHVKSEFLLLLNPDTKILDHAVDVIVDFARKQPAHGLYGGRTLKTDGSLEFSSCWGLPTLWSMTLFAVGLTTFAPRNRFLDPESLGSWPRDTVREVGVITGCFLLVSRATWKQLGGFDERYFMYGEDVDLALRAHQMGYRPVICPEAKLIHEVGQSSAKPIDKMLLLYRGKAELARTHWRGPSKHIALALLTLGVRLRALLGGVQKFIAPTPASEQWRLLWERRSEWVAGYGSSL